MNQDIKYTCPANNAHYMIPGPQGDQGPRGIPGKDGRDGKNGRDGINGLNGRNGNDGAQGKEGEQGPRGYQGEQGIDGLNGPEGPRGPMGTFSGTVKQNLIPDMNGKISGGYSLGDKDHWYSDIWAKEGHFSEGSISIGDFKISTTEVNNVKSLVLPKNIIIGEPGIDGQQGAIGQKGEPGEQGPRGADGINGVRGPAGPPGTNGPQGPEGRMGIRGYKGDEGDIGEQGPRGEKGETGDTGDKGEKGDKGDQGDQVTAKTFTILIEDGKYSINNELNPNIYLLRGQKYLFDTTNVEGNSFWIITEETAYDIDVVYTDSGLINNGSANYNIIEFIVPYDAPKELFYVSQYDEALSGNIIIRDLTGNSLVEDLTLPNALTWTQVDISTYTYAQLAGIGNTPSNGGTDGIYNGVHPNPSATSGTDRKFSWNKEDFLFKRQLFNNLADDQLEDKFLGYNFNMKEIVRGGYIILYPMINESYNFTKLYISMNYRSAKFLLSGSNDKYNWTNLLDTNTSLGVKVTSNSNDYYTAVDSDANNSTYKFTFLNTNYYHYWRFKLIGNPVNNLAESTAIFRKLTSLNQSFNMLSNYSEDVNTINVPNDAFFVKLEGGPITIKYVNGTASTTGIRVIRLDSPDEQIPNYVHKSDENIAIIGPPENTTYNIVEEFTLTDDQAYYFIVYHGQGYNAQFSVSRGMSQFRINDFRFS